MTTIAIRATIPATWQCRTAMGNYSERQRNISRARKPRAGELRRFVRNEDAPPVRALKRFASEIEKVVPKKLPTLYVVSTHFLESVSILRGNDYLEHAASQ